MTRTEDAILLLDDGELDPVVAILERSGLRYRRSRGSEISDGLAPPSALLITTARHADKVRPGSPAGALAGRPVRIVAVKEDSPSLRRMMRTRGFHLLIRQPAHEEVWRLSIQRALFQGEQDGALVPFVGTLHGFEQTAVEALHHLDGGILSLDFGHRNRRFLGGQGSRSQGARNQDPTRSQEGGQSALRA